MTKWEEHMKTKESFDSPIIMYFLFNSFRVESFSGQEPYITKPEPDPINYYPYKQN